MIQHKNTLKEYFETGDKPDQNAYWNLIESLRHAYDKIPLDDLEEEVVTKIEFNDALNNTAKTNEDNNFSSIQTFGQETNFGGQATFSTPDNIIANFTSTDSVGEIRIADSIAYTRLLTGGTDFKIMPNDGTEVAVFEGGTLKTDLKGSLEVATTGTFGSSATASTFLAASASGWLVKSTLGNHGVYFDGTETIIQSQGVFSVRANGTSVNLRNTYIDGLLDISTTLDVGTTSTFGSTATFGASSNGGVLTWDTNDFYIASKASRGLKLQVNGNSSAIDINSSANTTFYGEVSIPSKLHHTGDSDTYLNFTTDQIDLVAGNFTMLRAHGTAQRVLSIPPQGGDIDVAMGWLSGTGFYQQGSTGHVGINAIPSIYNFEVGGTSYFNGNTTIDGVLTGNKGISIPDYGATQNSLNIGTGNDMVMYHDGADTYFQSNNGNVYYYMNHESSHIFHVDGTEKFRVNNDGASVKGSLEVTTVDDNRYVKFKAPNGESRFDFYTGGTGNPSNLQMYQADGTTIGAQIHSNGSSFVPGSFTAESFSSSSDATFGGLVTANEGGVFHQTNTSYSLESTSNTNYKNLLLNGSGESLIKFGSSSFNSGNGAELWQKSNGDFRINLNSTKLGLLIEENQNITTEGDLEVGGNLTVSQGSLIANAHSGARHVMYSDTADAPLLVRSGDAATGIAFQDNNGASNIYYWGSGNYFQAEGNWWVTGDIKSRGGDMYAGRLTSDNVDSGSYYLLESVDTTWGTNANGFRLHLNGDSNDFSLEAASDTTTDTIFSVDRGVSGDFIVHRNMTINNDLSVGGNLTATGDIQPDGTYKSSDGTSGFNGTFTAGAYDITVKDGLITSAVNIS